MSVAAPARLSQASHFAFERPLFWLSVIAACALMWLAPRLPMVDLPQHAAQVALWRDLLAGQSSWTDLVRINLFTPYLIGYGLLLPLSFVFSMPVATQVLLTLTLLAFVSVCVALRHEYGADKRLDWLFFLSFFGFCWKWGFMTFLVASPVGLLTLLLAVRHAKDPTFKKGLALVLSGIVLLFSHGLVFLGLMFISGLQMLEQVWRNGFKNIFARALPYLIIGALTLAFRIITQNMEGALHSEGFFYGTPFWERPMTLLADITDTNDDNPSKWLTCWSVLALLGPLLYGLKFNNRTALVPVLGLVFILAAAPADAFQTGGLYYRFSLFIPPFVAFAFRENPKRAAISARGFAAFALVALASWSVLFIQARRIHDFAAESRDFETVLKAAEPNKRMLMVVMEGESRAAQNTNVYWHYPAWYQAEKHGFIDFNFALFPPQVVRFKLDRDAGDNAQIDLRMGEGYWDKKFIAKYSYVLLRAQPSYLALLKDMSPCPLKLKSYDGLWFLLEREACPAG